MRPRGPAVATRWSVLSKPTRVGWLGLVVGFVLGGCRPHVPDDRCPGAVGYASDRAHELRVTIEDTLELPSRSACAEDVRACERDSSVRAALSRRVQSVARASEARGEPLFLGRATGTTRFFA